MAMTPKEAYDFIYRLVRNCPVIGDVGDTRDEALKVLKKFTEKKGNGEQSS